MSKTKKLFVAFATIILSIGLIVGSSYALFTDKISVGNHVNAGTLNVTLQRTKLTKTLLQADGTFKDDVNKSVVDFSNDTNENVFGFANGEVVVPTSVYTAEMTISNSSSVAFNYWIEIIPLSTSAQEFASQLTVEVVAGSKTESGLLSNGSIFVGSETDVIGTVLVGPTNAQIFTVSITFENDTANNSAMNQEAAFDMIVHAVQVTAN